MKYIIGVFLIVLTSCSLFTKTITVEKEKVVTITKECDTVTGQWSDTLWFVLPCDSAYIENKGDHTDTKIDANNGKITGRIITKQAKPKIIYLKKDSIVYELKKEPVYCEKWHVQKWHVWTFIISLLANAVFIYLKFK